MSKGYKYLNTEKRYSIKKIRAKDVSINKISKSYIGLKKTIYILNLKQE